MPTVEHETTITHRLALLETAQAHTRDELQMLSEKVDDHHADTIERLDQMRSDLQHAIGKTDRRRKAVERFQQEALDHFAFLTSKVTAHDARFDRIEGQLSTIDSKLNEVLALLTQR
ncbi:MAG TPA: hypothetical protein VNQ48_09545 [Microbacteriaceae bacterium]|nr:hypothetical protein [Microbacteriaceae bacterium]